METKEENTSPSFSPKTINSSQADENITTSSSCEIPTSAVSNDLKCLSSSNINQNFIGLESSYELSSSSPEIPALKDEDKLIIEGKAELIYPCHVFYNPVQEFNRDLSIAVLSVFSELYQKEQKDEKSRSNTHEVSNTEIKQKSNIVDTAGTTSNSLQADIQLSCYKIDEKFEAGKYYENGITILEGLSATGLRSVRYAKEIPGIRQIIANDISRKAVESIKSTISRNHVQHIVRASHEDATMIMYRSRKPELRFNAIDLDPYGCPSIFLDSAVQAVSEGGLLLVTATDMAVLAGNAPETCYTKYGSISLHSTACHEMALRILLQCIQAHASRYGRYIVPLLSVSIDFYIRVFVRIYTSPKECKKTTSKLAYVHQCVTCESRVYQPLGVLKPFVPRQQNKKGNISEGVDDKLCVNSTNNIHIKYSLPTERSVSDECAHCKSKIHSGGPIWMAELHDQDFVSKVLNLCERESDSFGTAKRLQGVLTVVSEELPDPLYYTLPRLCSTLHMQTLPILTLRSAILNAGKKVSYSHACKTSIKTDASTEFIWDILRAWQKDHPVKKERLEAGTAAANILSKPPSSNISFVLRHDANPRSRKQDFVRFPQNPEAHWGPGTRGNVNKRDGEKLHKSIRNQNKKQKNQ